MVLSIIHLLGVLSCRNDCSGAKYFRVLDLFLANVNKDLSTINNFERIADGITISYRRYAIGLTHGIEYYSNTSNWNIQNPFITSSFASDPIPPGTEETTTSIRIISDEDYITSTDTLFAGQSLNALFDIDFNSTTSLELNRFLQSEFSIPYEHAVFLFLNTPPSENQMHRFTVFYELDNVISHRATTNAVIIGQ